jgi:deoxyribodipyrimidine photo-lyase
VVTDDFPAFFMPRMIAAAAKKLDVRLEPIDSNGLLPMGTADRAYPTAYAFRRFLQKTLPGHLLDLPRRFPLRIRSLQRLKDIPPDMKKRWPPTPSETLNNPAPVLSSLPLNHRVAPLKQKGGTAPGNRVLKEFLDHRIHHYSELRNQPEEKGPSELSPYLHFGHISSHQIFDAVMEQEDWFMDRLSEKTTGSRSGWWGMDENAEAFLDQLITWRELGFNMCRLIRDYDRYDSLPGWARETLAAHEGDERPYRYELDVFEGARTHDPLWNAAQNQLVREGRIHNYLRMLWGKKILQWAENPREALEVMIHLNNKYAVDGRDPNSYSGIFWVLGRYDRPWGPERPVFGKIRYMSSKNTARKVRVKDYIKKYSTT